MKQPTPSTPHPTPHTQHQTPHTPHPASSMKYEYLSIKNWSVEDRPREKLIKKGVSSLSNAELLAILLGSGTRNITAVELAKSILHQAENNLGTLGKTSLIELLKIKGVGEAKAISILAALELGRRRNFSEPPEKSKITSSHDAFNVFQPLLGDLPHEEFWILLLNRSNKIIEKYRISQGGISGTVIDTRLILKKALDKLASGIILCHNHPSGNKKPSEADKSITYKIQKAAKVMDISLLDHIIVADKDYFSFADNNLMNE
jgi:DNA repair protein RadC